MSVTPERLNAWFLESGPVETITPGDEKCDDRIGAAAYRARKKTAPVTHPVA
ncbi:hypothetical protein [Streptomyces sp. NPDC050504]|uniref:hypothetical protein n=1 Tax=Streptomyces sp. NPDC050504 TaxID=3365618 RepID=UPI0037B901A0